MRLIASFKAQSDDGRIFPIYKYQDTAKRIQLLDSVKVEPPGDPYYRTTNDMTVYENEDGTYLIDPLNLIVKKIP